MLYKIDEIKTALSLATPGPWAILDKYVVQHKYDKDDLSITVCKMNTHIGHEEDAHLIANAPTWLLHQQELIEQLQRELKHSQDNMKMAVSSIEQKDRLFAQIDFVYEEAKDLCILLQVENAEKDMEIEKLKELNQTLTLTPMQKMSKAIERMDYRG